MLKLKYLFDNRDLALMLLSDWEYDRDRLDIMDNYRISANAIYPFYQDGEVCFLRFTPTEEKQLQAIQAELDFIRYLLENGYHSPKTVLSKGGHEIAISETPWGKYVAVVFKSVGNYGQRLDRLEYSDILYYGFGETLGRLHLLSKKYAPVIKRPDWRQNLQWASDVLKKCLAPDIALKEVAILEDFFAKLPATQDNYGLVHYDFELDNVFFNRATSQYGVIDFDDAIYHWFVMDIEQSVDSLKNELPENLHEQAVSNFLSGYRSILNIEESMLSLMPVFRRYANIFGYARSLRSLNEKWKNEPDWMINLRKHIEESMVSRSKCFGENIYLP